MGEAICLGDLRALLGRIEGKDMAKRLLKTAGVKSVHPDNVALYQFRNDLWSAFRQQFPAERNVDGVKDICMFSEEGTMDYLKRAANLWAKHTGSRHDVGEANQALWRRQCIKGLPKLVQDSLEEVVGLNKLGYPLWVEHGGHHCRRYQVKKEQEEEELKALNKRLLRHQVAKGDEEINKGKTKGPPTRGNGSRFFQASQMPAQAWQPEENNQY